MGPQLLQLRVQEWFRPGAPANRSPQEVPLPRLVALAWRLQPARRFRHYCLEWVALVAWSEFKPWAPELLRPRSESQPAMWWQVA